MNFKNRLFALGLAGALVLGLLTGCGAKTASSAAPAASAAASSAASAVSAAAETGASSVIENAITVDFSITYADGTAETLALTCADGATLADALLQAGVISQAEHDAGFVTTVNGVTADYTADKAWWSLLDKDGEMTAVGIADITLAEGDAYSFAYTVG